MPKQYQSPHGSPIVGTSDTVPVTAFIHGISYDGKPDYQGSSEVYWDDQKTRTRGGKILFIDEAGDEWTFDQLTEVTEDPE